MFAFTRTQRLLNKAQFDYVFAQAKRNTTAFYIVLFRKNNVGHARLGFALSKKMVPKAHDRNRIKRILRESFRIQTLPPVDIIVLAKPGIVAQSNSSITSKLSKTWEQLQAYCDS